MNNYSESSFGAKALIFTTLIAASTAGAVAPQEDCSSLTSVCREITGTGGVGLYTEQRYDMVSSTSYGGSSHENRSDELNAQLKIDLFMEIIEDFVSPDSSSDHDLLLTDDSVDSKSLVMALRFLLKMSNNLPFPTYDVHPDGQFSFVWREKETGILSLAFEKEGGVNYASYFSKSGATHKGKVFIEDEQNISVGSILHNLINEFS